MAVSKKHQWFFCIRTAASTLAGDSSLGSASIEITLTIIVSTVCIGNHLSEADSYPHLSSPGSWRIDMHTDPSFSTENEIKKTQENKNQHQMPFIYFQNG